MKDPKDKFRKPRFSLQWHLTTVCPNNCKHCYIDKKKKGKLLSFNSCKKIADDFLNLVTRWEAEPRVYLTGGDPLLFPYFFETFEYLRKILGEEAKISILGNPELLDGKILQKIASLNPFFYQLSLDGTEKIHDFIRYRGSFCKTIKAVEMLQSVGIKVAIMCTVSNLNIKELPLVVDLVKEKGVRFFDFARFAPTNNQRLGKNRETLIPPLKYRKILLEVAEKYDLYRKDKDCITSFGKKDPLWALLDLERGQFHRLTDPKYKNFIMGGCNIGATAISILEDGTVLGCRRIFKPIGKVPEQKLRDIFIGSETLNEMRNIYMIQKCKECELLMYCRGCRAIPYGYTGNIFAPDPQCWKDL